MRAEGAPSASDIVYLFGDRFARKARAGGEKLIYRGTRVNVGDLGEKLVLLAFVGLASEGYLEMERVEQKRLGILSTWGIRVMRSGEPRHPLYGLEAAVWSNIRDDPTQDRVRAIISRIVGRRCENPWRVIVEHAKIGLAEHGYLVIERERRRLRPDKINWSANEGLILAHDGKVDEVKGMLSSLETRDPTLYKQLADSVKKGIQAMRQAPVYL